MPLLAPDKPQRLMIDHMQKHKEALLFCGMSLGKTSSVLYHLNELFQSGDAFGALIIAPMRVANLTWPEQAQFWEQFRWMKVSNLRTESGKRAFLNGTSHVYVLNWEGMANLVNLVERRKGTLPFDVVVYDELTKSKNPGSKRVNLYRRKVPRVERQIGLTGTPIPNSTLDLFAQVRLVDGGHRLGTNFTNFKREYFYGQENHFAPWKPKAGAVKLIEERISDITLTLKSSDWLDIPDTVIEDVEIEFTPELKGKYQTLEKELVIELRKATAQSEGKTINVASSAALITKLLQFTSGEMYDDEKHHHPIHDLKFQALKKIIKAEKQPVFVATMFKHEYKRMKEVFPESVFFNDAKSIADQTKLMADWNAKKIPILFAHPASIGHGLNLQFGSSVLVFLSLTYNREYYDQIIARFARRGQTEITRVFRLMVPGTVDDAVAEALANKAATEARLISALQMLESYRNTK